MYYIQALIKATRIWRRLTIAIRYQEVNFVNCDDRRLLNESPIPNNDYTNSARFALSAL